jgi:hypothetical protein
VHVRRGNFRSTGYFGVFPGTEKIESLRLAHAAVLSTESAAGEAKQSLAARLVVVIR